MMNRLFSILRPVLVSLLLVVSGGLQASDITVTPSQISGAVSGSATYENLIFTASKANAANAPVINATYGDLRVYAKGTLNVKCTDAKIAQIVFTLSTQGKRRLAPITASTGTVVTQQVGDETVVWTGSASDVTFTVGDKASYGSDGSSKAGQFCFSQIDITYEANGMYVLTTAVSPASAGTALPEGNRRLSVGATFVCSTTANADNGNFKFQRWVDDNDVVVSTNSSFTYTMPERNVTLTAVYEYDPESPGNPYAPAESYTLTLKTSPANAGTFNRSETSKVVAGTECDLYTYYNGGYWFREWQQNGQTVSTSKNYKFRMPEEDVTLVAVYDYNPTNPANPGKNFWHEATGEVIIDDFKAGSLNTAINNVVKGYNDKVKMITVAGAINQYDWGILNYYTACEFLDLSRTNGMTYVPSYNFDGNKSLTSIVLPAGIEKIDNYAFRNCSNLTSISIHASTPPIVGVNALSGIGDCIVYVRADALSLYQEAKGWKDYTILPLNSEVSALEVNLPEGTDMSQYKEMYIELINTKSGQKLRYVTTNRTTYTFNSLIHRTSYNVYLKNASGQVLGELNDIDIVDQDVSVTFSNLLVPRSVSVLVETPDGEDLTDEVTVTWMDEKGNFLAKGNTLTRQLEGTKVMYRITLPQALAMEYQIPADVLYEVKAENSIVSTLVAIPQQTISGRVVDVKTGNALNGAVVVASQMLNGQYSKTFTTKTNATGDWSLTVFDASTDITASMTDYVSKSLSLETLTAEVPTFELKDINGTTIMLNLTYTNTDGDTQNYYSDYANVEYMIVEKATGQQISDFNVQYPQIVLMSQHEEGAKLQITASSKSQKFMPVTVTAIVDAVDRAIVTLPIVQLGGISASFKQTDNNSIVGILYDGSGKLMKKYDYDGSELLISELIDGTYTLVTMANSQFFNSVNSISQFAESGLKEGLDYVKNMVTVKSGEKASIANSLIPYLDETKLYYTGENTSFTVNKNEIVAGQYLTLNSRIDFKQSYVTKVSDVQLVVELPEESSFVENSVLYGSQQTSYIYNNHSLTIPLENYSDRVRFCYIPTSGGTYAPMAYVKFVLNGKEFVQPIGEAKTIVKAMSINTPEKVSLPYISISGVASAKSKIEVFDNGILIGQTNSISSGGWQLTCDLPNREYEYAYHKIYARITTPQNVEFITETKTVTYDKNYVDLESVEWLFGPYDYVLNFANPTTKALSYTYPHCGSDFTFVLNFTNNDPSAVSGVKVNVLCMDQSVTSLDAFYDVNKGRWIAYGKFTSSSALPINCNVEYYRKEGSFDNSVRHNEEYSNMEHSFQVIEDYADENVEIETQNDDDNRLVFTASNPSNTIWGITVQVLEKSSIDTSSSDFEYIESTEGNYHIKHKKEEGKYSVVILDDNGAYEFSYSELNQKLAQTRRTTDWSALASSAKGALGLLGEIGQSLTPYYDYCMGVRDYDFWVNERYSRVYDELTSLRQRAWSSLRAKCPDGSRMVRDGKYQELLNKMQRYQNLEEGYESALESMANLWRTRLLNAFYFESLTSCVGKALKAIPNAQFFAKNGKNSGCMRYVVTGGKAKREQAENLIERSFENTLEIVEQFPDWLDFADFQSVSGEYNEFLTNGYNNLRDNYIDLIAEIEIAQKPCKKKKDPHPNKDYPNPSFNPYIDPSGYVYEAVSSNRVQGVTATAYYKETVEDMYGDLHENIVKWNAEEYAQENPLFTDENGMYQWDVPQGLWQVKFEKEGYQTTYSEWLPVPPPQLDVNIAMTQMVQPVVTNGKAFAGGVDMEFSKYMDPETLTADNIMVTRNGNPVNGEVKLLNEEVAYEGQAKTYASKVRFEVAENEELVATDEVVLTVRKAVKSYAGVPMEADYQQQFDVELPIRTVSVDSLINVAYGGQRTLTVAGLPTEAAKGKKLQVKSLSTMIAAASVEEVTLDENGQAEVTVNGELPGSTVMTFTVEDDNVSGQMTVNVKDAASLVAVAPRASRVSGTVVYRGTQIRLSSETENATIYYTLDGTCPCDLTSESVIKYNPDEPIIINDDQVTIKAIATGHDLGESEVAEFTYSLKKTALNYQLPTGWTWISHNLEEAVPSSTFQENAERIVSQTREVINDPVAGLIGNLSELQPAVGYKVKVSAPAQLRLSGNEFNASAQTVNVVAGWNWIGYPLSQTMTIDEALTFYAPSEGDYLVGQEGFAEYADGGWHGTLEGMVPGKGYLYKSATDADMLFNTTIVSDAVSQVGKRKLLTDSPWTYDKNAYQNIMPVIAELYSQGSKVADGEYMVGAFADTECRGIGQWKEGRLLMSVYGDGNEEISFIAVDPETEKYYDLNETLVFEPDNKGSWNDPLRLTLGQETTGITQLYAGLTVTPAVARDHITVNAGGNYINRLTLTAMNGVMVLSVADLGVGGTLTTGHLADGVYVMTVQAGGKTYYKKIIKANK